MHVEIRKGLMTVKRQIRAEAGFESFQTQMERKSFDVEFKQMRFINRKPNGRPYQYVVVLLSCGLSVRTHRGKSS